MAFTELTNDHSLAHRPHKHEMLDSAFSQTVVELPAVIGATITNGIAPITQSFHALFPAAAISSTSTATDATSLTDSAQTPTLNQYAGYYIVTNNTTGPAYGTIQSNSVVGKFVIDAWSDETGAGTTTPSTALYQIIPSAVDLSTLSKGAGNQLLYLTVAPIMPVALLVTVTVKHNVDNIIMSAAADITLTPVKVLALMRRGDLDNVVWMSTL
jgi:hypothetical protein